MKIPRKFLLVTGTTGGHIFPLLFVAHALKEQGHDVHFLSTGSVMEKEILDKNSFPVDCLKVGRLRSGVSFFERISTIFLLPFYLLKSFFFILKIKPHVVIGVGGALSGPVLLMASWMRKRTMIWELNAVPGLANKILSFFVQHILICFSSAQEFFDKNKCVKVSFPVRRDLIQKGSQKREADGFSHLLILGGSQGSHKLNQVVMEMYNKESLETWKIYHQTGKKDFNSIQNLYSEKDRCIPFIEDMGESYKWADVIISRGGASTLSELAACGKAVIIVPLDSSADQHQYKNALEFYQNRAIELISEKELTASLLFEKIMNIDSKKKRELESNIQKFYNPDNLKNILDFLIHE